MSLPPGQELERLVARTLELRAWLERAWVALPEWTFDGKSLALAAPWPERGGVHAFAHGRVDEPGGERRLVLDRGGEGLVTVAYAGGGEERFGLDLEHRAFPLRDGALFGRGGRRRAAGARRAEPGAAPCRRAGRVARARARAAGAAARARGRGRG